jgi:hypothetical protein
MRKEPSNTKRIVFVIILLIAIGAGVFFFIKYRQAVNDNPQAETKDLTATISKSVQLPNETPTVATVVDKNKLANKALSSKAKNGDKLLIYSNAKRLILYRPDDKKVIDMLSISTNTANQQQGTEKSN